MNRGFCRGNSPEKSGGDSTVGCCKLGSNSSSIACSGWEVPTSQSRTHGERRASFVEREKIGRGRAEWEDKHEPEKKEWNPFKGSVDLRIFSSLKGDISGEHIEEKN